MNTRNTNKLQQIIATGEKRVVNGLKTMFLPCIDPEYQSKEKRPGSRGKIAKAFKNRY